MQGILLPIWPLSTTERQFQKLSFQPDKVWEQWWRGRCEEDPGMEGFSTFLTLRPFKSVPRVVVIPNPKFFAAAS